MAIIIKSEKEIARMRRAGQLTAMVLELLKQRIRPGVSTADLDRVAYDYTVAHGGKPSFKGYHGYPASVCTSINSEVVHGIPSPDRILKEGDIVSLDFGAIRDGFQGDAAITVGVGQISDVASRLMMVTEEALYLGIKQLRAGNKLSAYGRAVQEHVEANGFSVVRQYVGHGIGRSMHEDPQIPNFVSDGPDYKLRIGMTLAVEPMVNAGSFMTRVLDDKWTVVTEDGSLSAHFEHTVAICKDGPQILTLP